MHNRRDEQLETHLEERDIASPLSRVFLRPRSPGSTFIASGMMISDKKKSIDEHYKVSMQRAIHEAYRDGRLHVLDGSDQCGVVLERLSR